jgi:hypothetical protein
MKKLFIVGAFILFGDIVVAQNVGIGTTTPVAKLNIVANGSSPAIPGATSSAIFRIGVAPNDAIDFGKLNSPPYSAWMQAGFNATADPLSLQPLGGNVGIGITEPTEKLDVNGAIKIGTTATNQPGAIRFNAGKFEGGDGTNWKSFEGITSGIVGTKLYNNPALLNAGYTLFGEISGISSYSTVNTTFSANTWQPTYTIGIVTNVTAPQIGDVTCVVGNGSLMYVATFSDLYAYNPTTDIWSIVSNQGFNHNQSQGIWTGTEIIFWHGDSRNGARYNPATNIWTALPVTNAPSQRYGHTMIWDGTRIIIWGGQSTGESLNTGAMYNTATNTWTTMNTVGAPTARFNHTTVWDNASGRMIIWGGNTPITGGELSTGGLFNPVSNAWTGATNTVGAPSARIRHTAVWTGTEMIVFGGVAINEVFNTGGKYNPSTNNWTPTSISGANAIFGHAAVWTGTKMFVTGGRTSFGISIDFSGSYNPSTNLWTNNPNFSSNGVGKESHYSFLGNNMIVVWGGLNKTASSFTSSNTGSRYFLTNIASSATTITNETLYLYQKN